MDVAFEDSSPSFEELFQVLGQLNQKNHKMHIDELSLYDYDAHQHQKQTYPEKILVWLDKLNEPPDGRWVWAKSEGEVQVYFLKYDVEELSLSYVSNNTMELLDWMVVNKKWPRKKPKVHERNVTHRFTLQRFVEKYFPVYGAN